MTTAFISIIAAAQKQPPPPPPPLPPPTVEVTELILPTKVTVEFYKRNVSVEHLSLIQENQVLVRLKNGDSESYDLNVKDQKATFIKKYGEISVLAPPPPPKPPKPIKEPEKS